MKVKEILRHGFLEKTAALQSDASGVAFRMFCSVWGVGPRRAQVWVDRGLRTLQDVRNSEQCMAELSSREKTGLRHADDFRIRIPRKVCCTPLSKCMVERAAQPAYIPGRGGSGRVLPGRTSIKMRQGILLFGLV